MTSFRGPGGRTIAYEETGEPDAQPVVYCPGTPSSRLSRHHDRGVYERAGVRVIAYDRPGYGGSTSLPGRDVAAGAADVAALADELSLARFGVFGVSGGGPHALACGALLGERVSRVAILVGAAPIDDPEFDALAGMSPGNIEEFEAARQGREALAPVLERYVEAMGDDPMRAFDAIAHELPEPDQALLRQENVRAILRSSTGEAVRQGSEGWIEDNLAFVRPWGFSPSEVAVEVRLWQGELDVLVPRSHGEYLAARVPRASFELVPGAGHLLFDQWELAFRWLASDNGG